MEGDEYSDNQSSSDIVRQIYTAPMLSWTNPEGEVIQTLTPLSSPESHQLSERDIGWIEENLMNNNTGPISRLFAGLWFQGGLSVHAATVSSHKRHILMAYLKLKPLMEHVTLDRILHHDDSKYLAKEWWGYIDRWVYGIRSYRWIQSVQHHYGFNDHHIEYLYCQGPGSFSTEEETPIRFREEKNKWKTNQNESTIADNMSEAAFEEHMLDVIACQWERKTGNGSSVVHDNFNTIQAMKITPWDNKREVQWKNKMYKAMKADPDKWICTL